MRPFSVVDPKTGDHRDFRVLYVWSSEEASSVAEGRERALARAESDLAKVRRGLGGRYYKTKAQVEAKVATILIPAVRDLLKVSTGLSRGKPTLSWQRDQQAIADAARCDGVYALATNIPGRLSPPRILRIYKSQWVVEQRHRDAKQTLRVRPIFLHNDDRIEALVSVVGLALIVFGLIENVVRKGVGDGEPPLSLLPERRAVMPTGRAILAAFQGLQLTYTSEGIRLDQLTATQRRILQLLDAHIPWMEGQHQPFVNCGKRA